jgi:GNAT superfamily N-acetyltransferase
VSEIIYRQAQEADLERTYQVFVRASHDLAAAHNFPQVSTLAAPPQQALAFRRHALSNDAQRFWVAEVAAEIVGFGVAILHDQVCYLAALHVMPAYQGQGIGRTLLERCMGRDNAPKASLWTTIADSLNPVSNAIYARFGMIGWVPLIPLSGSLPTNAIEVDSVFAATARSLADSPQQLAGLAAIDQQVLGFSRNTEHQHWLRQPDVQGYCFGDPARPFGYVYLWSDGAIGPLAVKETADIEPMLAFCLQELQAGGIETVSIKLPGLCRGGVRYLVKQGLHFGHALLILSSEPFGQLDRYAVSGGDALF